MGRNSNNPSEQEIRGLQRDLYSTRQTIVDLMPDYYRSILESYHKCEAEIERLRWQNRVADEVVSRLSDLLKQPGIHRSKEHVPCPLCGGLPDFYYSRGFTFPLGLHRHLTGWGNTHQCKVMDAVMGLAHGSWERKFGETDRLERIRETEELAERRETELLYLISPDNEPRLVDESFLPGLPLDAPRDTDRLRWAEKRLVNMGFEIRTKDRIRSYEDEHDSFVVFADPREEGRISFLVFKKPLPKNLTSKRRSRKHITSMGEFYILDTWHVDLKGKYQKRIASPVPD